MNLKESFNILRRRFEQKNMLYISGNVYDKYLKYEDGKATRELESLVDVIKSQAILSLYTKVVYFRPEQGLKDLMTKDEPEAMDVQQFLSSISPEIENSTEGKVYIIDLADTLFSAGNNDPYLNEISRILSAVVVKGEKEALTIATVNKNSKVIFIMRDPGNMIKDISNKNNEFGQVSISNPDRDERSDFLSIYSRMLGTTDKADLKLKDSQIHKEALALTSGMSYKEILQMARLSDEDITFKELSNISKFNKVQSEWEKLNFSDVDNIKEILSRDVMGQDFALENVERALKNSLLGLNGAMNGANNKKPKGILFFSGPTGVGKTELAKSLAKFVFGDDSRMIRFDMSEFSQEQSDQRLIGAPPGYVGYDGGGELTNAVRDEPQSIILFDEIEKANSKILDKFLQILEDGRLTSSQGELIDFSETFIIFTSNIGSDIASPDSEEVKNRESFRSAVIKKFRNDLGRPEILNRIGVHNIIPFNFINDKKILMNIFLSKFKKLSESLMEKHDISLSLPKDNIDEVFEIVRAEYDPRNGGRGLISAMEVTIQNELTNFIFKNPNIILNKEEKITNIEVTTNKTKVDFNII